LVVERDRLGSPDSAFLRLDGAFLADLDVREHRAAQRERGNHCQQPNATHARPPRSPTSRLLPRGPAARASSSSGSAAERLLRLEDVQAVPGAGTRPAPQGPDPLPQPFAGPVAGPLAFGGL